MVGCHTRLRQVRQGVDCPPHFPLDATSEGTFPLVPPDTAHTTIAPPDSPLIHSASRHNLYSFPAISDTLKGSTLGKNDLVVRTPPYSSS